MNVKSKQFGIIQIGIIALAVVTGIIHITLKFPDPMFILNGLGYLGLTTALFVPLPFLAGRHGLVRYILMGFTLLTILLWVAIGLRTPLGYITKVIELALLALLWLSPKPA